MVKKLLGFCCLFLLICSFSAAAPVEQQPQTSESRETDYRVSELVEFHKVIYLIWHEAYPTKDYAALKSYLPDIFTYTEKLYNAPLPGILRDKEAKWKEGLAELKKTVDAYSNAAKNNDDEALLNAAELLHGRYEMLVRVIRPVLPEIDEFHKVLYVTYHKYLPNKEYEKIKMSSEELKSKAEAITAATLPKRMQSKTEDFKAAAGALLEASSQLVMKCQSRKKKGIEDAVNEVHAKYVSLEKIFD